MMFRKLCLLLQPTVLLAFTRNSLVAFPSSVRALRLYSTIDDFGSKEGLVKDELQSKRVFVSNIPLDTDWKALKDHFNTVGRVAYASISTDLQTKKSKGFGLIQFEDFRDVSRAIELLNGSKLYGNVIHVREDVQERKKREASALEKEALRQRQTRSLERDGYKRDNLTVQERKDKEAKTKREASRSKGYIDPRAINRLSKGSSPEATEAKQGRTPLPAHQLPFKGDKSVSPVLHAYIQGIVDEREALRANGDFEAADALKTRLLVERRVSINDRLREWRVAPLEEISQQRSVGMVHDNSDAIKSMDSAVLAEITAKVAEREKLRTARQFAEADEVRTALRQDFKVQIDDRLKIWRVLP